MGLFDKIGEAKITGGGNQLRRIIPAGSKPEETAGQPAFFELEVKRFWTDNTRNHGEGVFLEATILGTNHPEFRVGQSVDWCALSGGKAADMFLINTKKVAIPLASAMLGEQVDASAIDADVINTLLGPGKGSDGKPTAPGYFCSGFRLNCTVSAHKRKNGNGYIDVPNWSWPGAPVQ